MNYGIIFFVAPLPTAKIVLRVVPGYEAWLASDAKEELFN